MGDNAKQQITPEVVSVKIVGLDAAIVGDAAHDTVLRFSGAPAFTGPRAATYFEIVTTPADGTVIRPIRRGKYKVDFGLQLLGQAGATTCIASITEDAVLADLALDPTIGKTTTLANAVSGKAAADATNHNVTMSATVEQTQQKVNAPAGSPRGEIRLQASNGANATPGAQVVLGSAWVRITWLGDCQGAV